MTIDRKPVQLSVPVSRMTGMVKTRVAKIDKPAPARAKQRAKDAVVASGSVRRVKDPAGNAAARRVKDPVGTGTVRRVTRLLGELASARGQYVSVSELAGSLGLPMPTIHRLLQLLRENGIVDWNSGNKRYSVGPELYRIAALVTSSADLPKIAQRQIDQVAEQLGETTLFGTYLPSALGMAFVARAEGRHALQYRIELNTVSSLVWGASGKAILAYLPQPIVEKALAAAADSASGKTPPELAKLNEELARVRRIRYAVSEGEKLQGARGVAAPVFNSEGVIGSICVTSPRERVPIENLADFGQTVLEAAQRLSRSLGATV